ncbi:MAG: DUF2461 domain-containing protein, partial [Chitinophagaceae bacterium]|nr:DUF2461 domain-containing protein [Chitinophagaceae bacterium]
MIEKSTLQFLSNLTENNNREWMLANKKSYENAKENIEMLAKECIDFLTKKDKRYGDLVPKNCMFRLNRDVRFSKDKSPYKTNFGIAFSIDGKKSSNAGFYVHIDLKNSFVGGGIWMPMPEQLAKIRQEIDYESKAFLKIVNDKSFIKSFNQIEGEKLKNPPKGYDAGNEMVEFLKFKSFTVGKKITEKELLSKGLAKIIC